MRNLYTYLSNRKFRAVFFFFFFGGKIGEGGRISRVSSKGGERGDKRGQFNFSIMFPSLSFPSSLFL